VRVDQVPVAGATGSGGRVDEVPVDQLPVVELMAARVAKSPHASPPGPPLNEGQTGPVSGGRGAGAGPKATAED